MANEKGEWCEHMTNDIFKLLCMYGATVHGKLKTMCIVTAN